MNHSYSKLKRHLPVIVVVLLVEYGILISHNSAAMGPDIGSYASYAQSLYFDGDLLFINEFEAWHKPVFITSTGYASALQNIGTAFFWIPLLAVADWTLSFAKQLLPATILDPSVATAGYDSFYFHALNFGTWLYGLVTLTLCFHLSRRYFSPRATLLALFFVSFASPFFYYMTYFAPNPVMPSTLMATAFILTWDRSRRQGIWAHWFMLGSLGGVLLSLANYNISFICFPLISLASSVRGHKTLRATITNVMGFGLGLLLGFLPQLLTWRVLFGSLYTPYAGQLDWLHSSTFEVLFSTYHGLYFYAPFLLLATAGILLLVRKDHVLALGMISTIAVQAYVSGANFAWWGGGSFGMRYLLPLTPVFILGAATLFEARPPIWFYLLGCVCLAWTYLLFLGIYSGQAAVDGFYPLTQQWDNVLRTLKDLPHLVANHLLGMKSDVAGLLVIPFTIISLFVVRTTYRLITSGRLASSHRIVLALALSPILFVVLILRAEMIGAAHLKDFQTQVTYQTFPRANSDPWDMSYSYSERAKYELRSGNIQAADEDYKLAFVLYSKNSWAHLEPYDMEHIPNRVDWQFANGVNLIGYSLDNTSGTLSPPLRIVLYWSVRTEPPAPFDVQVSIKDSYGQILGETTTTPGPVRDEYTFQYWTVRDIFREIYVVSNMTLPQSLDSVSIQVNLLDPANQRSWPVINQVDNVLIHWHK